MSEAKAAFDNLLRQLVERKGSDLHLKVHLHPVMRINEALIQQESFPVQTGEQLWAMIQSIVTEENFNKFKEENELDFAYSLSQIGRFRVNIFLQRGTPVLVARAISLKIPQFEDLCLPDSIKAFTEKDRGIILVTGSTGSGKSTTLAALINVINESKPVHILSVEDPIEFLHPDKKAVVNQREIGLDTKNFATALKHLLRQDPDVILIGEIRDSATMEVALGAADTGHLVFSTLHTTDARQTIERIINFFPLEQNNHVRLHLSLNLLGIVCQRLLPRSDHPGMIPAVEIMINTPRIRESIAQNKIYEITACIGEGAVYGMQTFNQSLYQLVKDGCISEETALGASSSADELRMQLRGIFPSVTDNKKGKTLGMQSRTMSKGDNIIFDDDEGQDAKTSGAANKANSSATPLSKLAAAANKPASAKSPSPPPPAAEASEKKKRKWF